MKVRLTSLSLPPTLPSSPSLSFYSSNTLFSPSLSFFHPSLKARLSVLDLLLHGYFPPFLSPLSPSLPSIPFPPLYPFPSFLLPCPPSIPSPSSPSLSPPFPFSSLPFPLLLPPPSTPSLGWYWHQARDASGEGGSLCLSHGHDSGDDHRAWFWGTEVHA